MTTAQIVAELRRSAQFDSSPWHGVSLVGLDAAHRYYTDTAEDLPGQSRWFFLLVAEALETER